MFAYEEVLQVNFSLTYRDRKYGFPFLPEPD